MNNTSGTTGEIPLTDEIILPMKDDEGRIIVPKEYATGMSPEDAREISHRSQQDFNKHIDDLNDHLEREVIKEMIQPDWEKELQRHLTRFPYKDQPEVKGLSWWYGYHKEFVHNFISNYKKKWEKLVELKVLSNIQNMIGGYPEDAQEEIQSYLRKRIKFLEDEE